MNYNVLEIGKRLNEFRKKLNLSQIELANILEIPQSSLSEMEKGRKNISYNTIISLLSNYYNLNIDWLLTGRGEMFIKKNINKDSYTELQNTSFEPNLVAEDQAQYLKNDTGNFIQVNDNLIQVNSVKFPKKATNNILVPVVAFGGYLCEWTQEYIDHDLVYLDVPGQPRDARTFEVSGTSMEPVIMSGDYVVCSRVERLEYIKTGFIYVIISVLEGITVKYVHDSKNMLILEPANRLDHAPTTIHKEDVKEIWQVVQRITKYITQPVQELFKPAKSPQNTNTSSV